jgi:ubiquinone/menaquinone biosynthesis C-methylase UbiE
LPDEKTSYLWDNAARSEVTKRFNSLESMYDPVTFQHFEDLGISGGWECLEVGGGGGSVTRWLSNRVGSRGRILVTDINPVFLSELEGKLSNVSILQHDITNESGIAKNAFNLAHARLVLIHLVQRNKALANMISALKSGGWLMIEDFDFIAPDVAWDYHARLGVPPTMKTELHTKVKHARDFLLEQHGADLYYARGLYSMLRTNGLTDVGISAQGIKPSKGGSAGSTLNIANSLQSKKEMIESGMMTEKEFDDAIEMMKDPEWTWISPLMVSAWGRKP